jgi:hypothetical protein
MAENTNRTGASMSDYFDRTETHLLRAVERNMPAVEATHALPRRFARMRRSRWRAVPVLLLVLLCGAAAAFASGLISFGAPAASVPVFATPDAGLGSLKSGSVQLLPISVPDPQGGPPWGMRVLSTTRGVGCIQVGRLLAGQLVALGQDGAFHDDGRAHALPVSADIQRLNCSLLDKHGRIFDSVTEKSQAASAAQGLYCRAPGTYPASHGPTPATCPLADERNLYYGLLGPDAQRITYSIAGRIHTVPTVGDDGAYLIVTTGTTHRYTGASGAAERRGLDVSDDVPVYGPITEIHYRSGTTCHLVTASSWIYGPHACAPAVPEPYGYVPTVQPTEAQLATPVHATLIREPDGRWAIRVSFKAPVAISSLRGEYNLEWHEPGGPPGYNAFEHLKPGRSRYGGLIPQGQNVARGQTLTAMIEGRRGAPLASGIRTGRVSLHYATGPLVQTEEDTARIAAGSFTIRVP